MSSNEAKANYFDTIVGIATPLGVGAIGIVRMSGPISKDILHRLCPSLNTIKPRTAYHATITATKDSIELDDGCILYFEGPKSYTGEDCVEFQCHSNPIILQQVVSECLQNGARLALPGEFTRRAFIHGKMDLVKAETVIDIIHAKNKLSKNIALKRLNGKLYKKITEMRSGLIKLVEQIEGSIDFPEEVPELNQDVLITLLKGTWKEIHRILKMQDFGKTISEGVNVLIMGKPNVGKSSLLNRIVGENRAIVTSIPGTTRDYIECSVSLGGGLFNFIDTAGIRASQGDKIEDMGMRKIKRLVKKANVILWIVDGGAPLTKEDETIATLIPKKKRGYLILNKSDKKRRANLSTLSSLTSFPHLSVSAKVNQGLTDLQDELIDFFLKPKSDVTLDFMCNIRQIQCLKDAENGLSLALKSIKSGFEQDLISFELKTVVQKLGEVSGDDLTEEVLDGIFSRFCVGK
ncbi:tRNA uridine-5-carboxymethylaminomethyl(34) synthesis GTPase MnmE [bacterium]|nr:tRNA uridine-5-carboxymethylaminomethyl(34) synthesis GTPase MnmE [bacterium]